MMIFSVSVISVSVFSDLFFNLFIFYKDCAYQHFFKHASGGALLHFCFICTSTLMILTWAFLCGILLLWSLSPADPAFFHSRKTCMFASCELAAPVYRCECERVSLCVSPVIKWPLVQGVICFSFMKAWLGSSPSETLKDKQWRIDGCMDGWMHCMCQS